MLEVAGGGDDDVARRVAGVVVGGDLGHRDRADHLGAAEHAAPERMVAEDRLGEDVVDAVLGLVLVHRDLLEHDLALGVDLVGGSVGREQHLGQQVERLLGVLVEEARVQVGRLLAGRGVGRGAHAVEELGDLDRRVALGALEQQVLEEVRDAGLRRRLVARAGPHPEPERDRAHRGHRLGDDPDAAESSSVSSTPSGRRRSTVRVASRAGRRRRASRRRRSTARVAAAASAAVAAAAGRRRRPSSGRRCRPSASSSGVLPATAGSSERRRPIRPRSLSTSTTVTSISSPG